MPLTKFLGCGALLFFGTWCFANELPVVPIHAVRENSFVGNVRNQPPVQGVALTPETVVLSPGVNRILPLSLDHLNRLVTPFSNPEITTNAQIGAEIRGSAIYIGFQNDSPVTLFLSEKGNDLVSLNLTLQPQRILAREVHLKLPGGKSATPMLKKEAKRWEKSQPYITAIRDLLRLLAVGEIPPGYGLVENQPDAARIPSL